MFFWSLLVQLCRAVCELWPQLPVHTGTERRNPFWSSAASACLLPHNIFFSDGIPHIVWIKHLTCYCLSDIHQHCIFFSFTQLSLTGVFFSPILLLFYLTCGCMRKSKNQQFLKTPQLSPSRTNKHVKSGLNPLSVPFPCLGWTSAVTLNLPAWYCSLFQNSFDLCRPMSCQVGSLVAT